MSAVLENDEPGAERVRGDLRGLEWNRVLASMDDQAGNRNVSERLTEIEITKTAPDALLHSADDPERGQIARSRWVGEISGDAQLERAVPVCVGIALAKA